MWRFNCTSAEASAISALNKADSDGECHFMKRILLLAVVALVSCSKSHLVSENAPTGTWQTDCLAEFKTVKNAPLSYKGSYRTNGNSTAVVTKFSDGACSKPYATITFEMDTPTLEKTTSNNAFDLKSFLRKVTFVAHTPEALTDLSADSRSHGTEVEASALVLEKAIDVTGKLASYEEGDLKGDFVFQFMKNDGEEYDESIARISVNRIIDEKTGQIVLDFPQAHKTSRY